MNELEELEELRIENERLKRRLVLANKPVSEIISPRLKPLRKERKFTQEDLGDLVGVSKMRVSDYESGKTEPPLKTLIKIADVFNVSLDWLCGRDKKFADGNPARIGGQG